MKYLLIYVIIPFSSNLIMKYDFNSQSVNLLSQLSEKDSLIISQLEFDKIVREFCYNFENDSIKTVEEAIHLCRIKNTLIRYSLFKEDYTRCFFKISSTQETKSILILDMTLGRGFGFYSPKYDIYLGGALNDNSLYKIEDYSRKTGDGLN